MLRRLRALGTPPSELRGVYTSFILPKLVYASPAWSPSLNITQLNQLERVQKRACRVILGSAYDTYNTALVSLNLPTLSERYQTALMKFGEGLLKNPRHRHLLPPLATPLSMGTRHTNTLVPLKAPRTNRYKQRHPHHRSGHKQCTVDCIIISFLPLSCQPFNMDSLTIE